MLTHLVLHAGAWLMHPAKHGTVLDATWLYLGLPRSYSIEGLRRAVSQLTFPGGISINIGGNSDVRLTTTYLDEKVRIGQGSRGSLFIFKREADGVPGELLVDSTLVCAPLSTQFWMHDLRWSPCEAREALHATARQVAACSGPQAESPS